MSANWYDLLGVDRDASSDEIRSSWKASIADLDPTDHRFGLYNKAAGVLLDDDARAAYDEELGPEPTPDEPEGSADSATDDLSPAAADEVPAATGASPSVTRFDLPVPVLALMLVLTLAAAGGAFWLHRSSTDPDQVESNISAARNAAEQAVPKVLTYDYRYPERDHDAAMRVLTGKIATSYDQIWQDAILPNLVKVKGTAVTSVIGSGVVRSSDDADEVELVVVLSSKTANRNTSTELPPIPMTVRMAEQDGEWLIQDMDLWQPKAAVDEGPDSGTDSGTDSGSDKDSSP